MMLLTLVICLLTSTVVENADVAFSGCDIEVREAGVVTSQNFPNPYPTDEGKCTIKVYAPLSHIVSLKLTRLDTMPSPSGKCNQKSDNVFVYDGDSSTASVFPQLAQWCGNQLPAVTTVVTTRNVATIVFRTHYNAANQHTGFKIRVKFIGNCGKSKYDDAASLPLPKIFGGIPARPFEFPWMVYVLKNGNQHCAATILNKNWMLTAGHCVDDDMDTSSYELRTHVHDRTDEAADFQSFTPSKIILHPDHVGVRFDIALFKVTDITFNKEVRPICMPTPDEMYIGRKAVVSGWGDTPTGPPDVLYYTTLEVFSDEVCKPIFPNHFEKKNMLCAADTLDDPDRDTCQGDSGGPIFVQEASGRFHTIGITSWGFGCAASTPGVYTRVTRYLNWIQDQIIHN